MPEILNKTFDNNSKLVVWKTNEDLNFFYEKTKLTNNDKNRINKAKTIKRKKELYCVRFILQNILKITKPLTYQKTGKPYIDNNIKISISHSHNYVAVFTSNNNNGVDIEKISEKPLRVNQKFLSKTETELLNNFTDKQEYYTLLWSVKETIFKLFSNKHLAFIDNIKIQNISKKYITVKILLNDLTQEQKVFYKKITNFVITWSQKQII